MEQSQLLKRFKSFCWRFGIALATFGLGWLTENLSSLELPLLIQGIVALGLGELSKWWNSKQFNLGKSFFGRILNRPKPDDRV